MKKGFGMVILGLKAYPNVLCCAIYDYLFNSSPYLLPSNRIQKEKEIMRSENIFSGFNFYK